jgi:hypothetical protein
MLIQTQQSKETIVSIARIMVNEINKRKKISKTEMHEFLLSKGFDRPAVRLPSLLAYARKQGFVNYDGTNFYAVEPDFCATCGQMIKKKI